MRALLLLSLVACSKPEPPAPAPADPPPAMIGVPGAMTPAPAIDRSLAAHEGALEIVAPARTPIGVATTARIRIRPGAGFHINTEYPFVVTLGSDSGMTIAKPKLAGGRGGEPGDAETLAEQELSIPITLTPTTAGDHTLDGTIQFGICKRDQCLTREAPIAVTVRSCDAAAC